MDLVRTDLSDSGTRDSGSDDLPSLSVIIPAVNDNEILLECLEALRRNARAGLTLELVVVDRRTEAVRRIVAARAADAVICPVASDTPIPQMRAVGIRRARAAAVAVIEDHVIVPGDWAQRLLDALSAGADVVGGSIENHATSTTVDWAAFFCEYSHLLAPAAGESVDRLPGNNVAYARAIAEQYVGLLEDGCWEDQWHAAMRRAGTALTCRPDIVVGHKMHYRMTDYLTQRFIYSRAYAGARRNGLAFWPRTVRAMASVGLPPLLLVRIISRVLASNRHGAELARSLPLLAVFVSAWAAGEVTGYLAGPGDAAARIR